MENDAFASAMDDGGAAFQACSPYLLNDLSSVEAAGDFFKVDTGLDAVLQLLDLSDVDIRLQQGHGDLLEQRVQHLGDR